MIETVKISCSCTARPAEPEAAHAAHIGNRPKVVPRLAASRRRPQSDRRAITTR